MSIQFQSSPKTSIRLWPAFVAIVLIAFFFRFYRLADHPLGLFFDPAINGLDAVRLMQRGGLTLFFPTNGGRESLFMYLLIPFIWLFGTTPFSLRALTATISLLNVVLLLAFLVDWSRFGPKPRASQETKRPIDNASYGSQSGLWPAVLAGLILAVSYWHIAISRLGQRPILVPMLAVPLVWFLLKGWITGLRRWFVLAGLVMGLAGYTYPAARLLPLILGLAVLPEFLLSPTRAVARTRLTGLLIFLVTAAVVYLPMAWYLAGHPAQFSARAFSVMIWNFLDTPAEIIAEIGRNVLRVLGFFCCAGSPNPIFGLPGYPGLSPWLTPFLLIGLLDALKHWRDLFHRLLALWWLIGIAPSIITIEAPHPLRMIVAVIPTAILIAYGFTTCLNWLQNRFKPDASRFSALLPWLPLVIITATIPGLYRAYFIEWTASQVTQGVYDYGAIAIRDQILERADDGGPIYLPLARFNDSTLLYYLSGTFQRRAALSVPAANAALVISPERNERDATWVQLYHRTATVLPPLDEAGQRLVQAALAGSAATPIRAVDGETVARLASLPLDPAEFVIQPTHALTVSFGPAQLTGANFEWVIEPHAAALPVTLYWQANRPMNDEYEVLLQLVDDARRVWGNGDARPTDWVYPTTFWRPGQDAIASRHEVAIGPERPPPGRYWLAVSLFDPATGRRLPLATGPGDAPDTFFMGPLKVPLPAPPLTGPDPNESVATFGNVARLTSATIEQAKITAGDELQLTLLWQALTKVEIDYTVFVHLLDTSDNLVAGHDAQPVAGHYPTSIWSSDEQILDRHVLPTPASLTPGQYRVAIGLYHQPNGERLLVHYNDGQADPQGRLILSRTITIGGRE